MTTPAIFNQVTNNARQSGQMYTNLYNNVFANVNGVTAAELVTAWGTSAGKYFTMLNDLKTLANNQDSTIIPTALQTYPNTVTINADGTVTLS